MPRLTLGNHTWLPHLPLLAHEPDVILQMTNNKRKASQAGALSLPAASPDAEAEAPSSEPEAPSNGSIYKQYTDGMTLPSPEPSSRPLELVVPMLKQEASHIYSSAAQDSPDRWVADNIPAQVQASLDLASAFPNRNQDKAADFWGILAAYSAMPIPPLSAENAPELSKSF